jgi:hypothetical protein
VADQDLLTAGGLSHSQQVGLRISLVEPRLRQSSGRLLTHPALRGLFPEYLFHLYCAVKAVVPLMETARARASAMAGSCPVAAQLVPYLSDHITEETGHDQWLLEDLEVLGLHADEVLARTPSRHVAALVGSQYYWVLHAHPAALLGYATLVEGTPVEPAALEYLESAGIPREGLRTLYLHAELDVGHGAEAARFLDSLPLTVEHLRLIGLSAIHSVEQLSLVIDEVVQGAE